MKSLAIAGLQRMLIVGVLLTAVSTCRDACGEQIRRSVEKGPVRLTVSIDPAEPALSDLVEMVIEITAPEGVDVKAPVFGAAVGDFLVRNYSEQPSPERKSAPNSRLFRYELEPAFSGIHLIRALSIEFTDNRAESEARGKTVRIESEPIEVRITSELGDAVPDLANLEPMVPPQLIDEGLGWWWVAVAALGVATVLFILIRFRRRVRGAPERIQTPEEIAANALTVLLGEDLPSRGLVKDFYIRLTGIVRTYIESTTGLRAPELTTEEFLREVRTGKIFPPDRTARLIEFLEAADMVKYAGQSPSDNQIRHSTQRASEFIAPVISSRS